MRAVIPVNVAALRVSMNDQTNVTGLFRGATVAFDKLPYRPRGARPAPGTGPSTGDAIALPLDSATPPRDALGLGVHLHWALPDYFRRGGQGTPGGPVRFPQVPNRWLVTRTSSPGTVPPRSAADVTHKSWIIESDYVAPQHPPAEPPVPFRPAISVPLRDPSGGAPWMYMGRVYNAEDWQPAGQDAAKSYLPGYSGPDGTPYYLTALGFVGPAFSGYYPDCRSVFGFWDTLRDLPEYGQLAEPDPVNPASLTLSYTVIGWIDAPAPDPLAPLAASVRDAYNDYVRNCNTQKVAVTSTPADFFHRATADTYGWTFSDHAFSATPGGPGGTITEVSAPDSTLCFGMLQDVVWSGAGPFLTPSGRPAQVKLAVGNTTAEAVAALVKGQLPPPPSGEASGVLGSYEVLLLALQLGLLRDLETTTTTLATLAEDCHTRSFARQGGGHVWTVQAPASDTPDQRAAQPALDLDLAEKLSLLNRAQEAYDTARDLISAARAQLFMDWTVYVRQAVADFTDPGGSPDIPTADLAQFLDLTGSGELQQVQALASTAGLVTYQGDGTSGTTGVSTASPAGTMAADLAAAFGATLAGLPKDTGWQLVLIPAAPFSMPTDPVLVMQGPQIEAARRNGTAPVIAVRAETELIGQLEVSGPAGQATAVLTPADAAAPAPPAGLPAAAGPAVVAALLGEAALLSPQSAGLLAAALRGHGFTAGQAELTAAVQGCQGGTSPLAAAPGGADGGLFGASRAADAAASRGESPFAGPQPAQQVARLRVVFGGTAALAPNSVGWSAQAAYRELGAGRADPFLSLWLTWEVRLWPLRRPDDDQYPATLISGGFGFDEHGIDLAYQVAGGAPPAGLVTPTYATSTGTTILSPRALASLTDQIGRFLADFAQDPADPELTQAKGAYDALPVLAQAIGTFNLGQTLRAPIPMIPVMDLVAQTDAVTAHLAAAAADPRDSWYAASFNSLAPQTAGNVSFAPLRGGFLEVKSLEIIDAFGQVMDLDTEGKTRDGGLTTATSLALTPPAGDTASAGRVYLPPRVLAPARVEARWLSAAHDAAVPGIGGDFADMNSHPATSPVCGWIVPNHLDVTLAFYDGDGSPVGSFGVEHGDLVYRTRAGHLIPPAGQPARNGDRGQADLQADVGRDGLPANVNPHVARLMWFVFRQDAAFLDTLMTGIADSDRFIAPAGAAQDPSLAVLIGRPLAIARASLAMTTAGRVVPPSQLAAALKLSVDSGWTRYASRQQHTSAGLLEVAFPARIGNLIDIDDGLVAFLPEAGDGSYTTGYLPALPPGPAGPLQRPGPAATQLRLNAAAQLFTLIVDPRAPVHVSTGVLPAAELAIPPEQYSAALRTLAVTFVTHPVLSEPGGPKLAVPQVAGYSWAWVAQGAAPVPLRPAGEAGRAAYGYTPQSLAEGWLRLAPQPDTEPGGSSHA